MEQQEQQNEKEAERREIWRAALLAQFGSGSPDTRYAVQLADEALAAYDERFK